jgi:preprotein translocase subunit SecA
MATVKVKPGIYITCYLNALAGEGVHIVTVNDYSPAATGMEWHFIRMAGLTWIVLTNINQQ